MWTRNEPKDCIEPRCIEKKLAKYQPNIWWDNVQSQIFKKGSEKSEWRRRIKELIPQMLLYLLSKKQINK